MRKVYVKNKKEDEVDSVDLLMGWLAIAAFFIVLCIFWALTVNAPVVQPKVDTISTAAPIVKEKMKWMAPKRNEIQSNTYIGALAQNNKVNISDIPKIEVSKEKPMKITVIESNPSHSETIYYANDLGLYQYDLNNYIPMNSFDRYETLMSRDLACAFIHDKINDTYFCPEINWLADETYVARNWGNFFNIQERRIWEYNDKFYEEIRGSIHPIKRENIPSEVR